MAASKKNPRQRKPRHTAERGIAGAYEGETVTRRRLFEGGAQAVGGVAVAAFGLPALGFALGPMFEDQLPDTYQDVGPERDFNPETYVPKVISIVPEAGEAGKATIYVRRTDPERDQKNEDQPYVAISTRCAHLGCPVRYVSASRRFICPCHGGVYGFQGEVTGGPPVRPLDRFYTKVERGRVLVGARFSLNSKLERFPHPRDPSNHIDGLWQYLYPGRPST
jgi:menaquinol-cytochrome c reductase iron-sulfur subunit